MTTNRRVLVDNATLSGVERLIGESQTLNLNNIDNDILCLEKLITAILFSDSIIGVDDYKDSFRSQRLKKFDFVDFLKIEREAYSTIARDAADFAKSMTFSFDGSKPAGDVVSFFDSLRIDPQLRWDIFVSSEYLTLSLLVNDKHDIRYETAIDSIFRNENADSDAASAGENFSPVVSVERHPEIADVKDLVRAFASGNSNFSGSASGSLMNRVVFGYGWTAERSHFYNAVASINEADAFLAPLRDAFCESCCRLESRSQVNSLLENLKSKTQEALVKIVEPRPFARVFRNIAQDMLNVERLGGLYDKLCSSVREHKDAMRPKVSVTPKFMERKESEHGRPAKL
jgi:hypothetical protein